MVGEFVMERSEVGLVVDGSPKVIGESDKVGVVGLRCLPTHLALDKKGPVDEQMWVVVGLGVFGFWLGGCQDYLLMIQH